MVKKSNRGRQLSVDSEKKVTKWENVEGRLNLAGVQYGDYQRISTVLKPGLILKMVGEPTNKYDKMAIRVEYAGYLLGYIPRFSIQQSECWNAHTNGYKLIAVLTAFNKTNPTWSMITIQIKRHRKTPVKARNTNIDL